MDDDLMRRVEALEADVARLRAKLDEPGPQASPAVPPAPVATAEAWQEVAQKPAWWSGSATGNQQALEARIGGKWLAIAGMTLLIIAVVFFFQLAVQRGWIGLAAQVALGVAFGIAVWGAGVALGAKQKLTGFAQVVSAGGIAIAAFAIFVAHHFPEYHAATGIGLVADSILLGLFGLAAALDAGLRRVPVQAGTATALVVWTAVAGLDATTFSLTYTVFMVAALLAVGVWRGWPWMAASAAPAAATVFTIHLIDGTSSLAILASVAVVHALILGAAVRLRNVDVATITGHAVAWTAFWILGGLALVELSEPQSFAWWSFGVAALGYAASLLVRPRALRLAAVIPATVAAIAAPLFLEAEAARIPIWLALFAGAEILRRTRDWTTSLSVRPVLLAVILMHAMSVELINIEMRQVPWITDLAMLLLAAAAGVVAWQGERDAKSADVTLPSFNLALGVVTLLFVSAAALHGPAVSVAWAVVAVVGIVAGFMFDAAALRVAGLAVFAAVLIRIVAIDLDGVDAIWRVLAFMGIAATLLLASWMYVRNAAKDEAT